MLRKFFLIFWSKGKWKYNIKMWDAVKAILRGKFIALVECSLEGLMLKLKLQYFGYLMQRADLLEKTLMLGKTEGRRTRWQRARWLDGITDSPDWIWANSGRYWRTGKPGVLQFMGWQRIRHNWATELNWGASGTLLRGPVWLCCLLIAGTLLCH